MNGYGGMPNMAQYNGGYQQNFPPSQQYMPQVGQQPMAQQPKMADSYNCVPVSSKEEALAVRAELFSMGTIMPDLAHGMMYLKRFNQKTGSPEFYEFAYNPPEPTEMPQAKAPQSAANVEYVPREDFNKLCNAFLQLQKEIENLKGVKGGETNVESV